MRLICLTPDSADADVLRAELARDGTDARVEAYAAARDVLAHIHELACDAVVIDTGVARALYLIDDLRRHLPHHPIVAITRAHGDEDAGMALVAGASECVARSGPWVHHLAAAVRRRVLGGEPPAAGPETPGPLPPPAKAGATLSELQARLDHERAARVAAEERYHSLFEAHEAERVRWADESRETERRWQELADQQKGHARLAAALRSTEDRLVALLDERRRETQHVTVLREQLSRQRGLADSAAAECTRLQADLAGARQHADRLESEQASQNQALDAQRARADQATADRDALHERVRAIEDEVARLERELAASLDRLGAAAHERTELATQLEQSGAKLADAIGRLTAAERDHAADRAASEAAARQLDELREALSRSTEALAAERTRAAAEAVELEEARRETAMVQADLAEERSQRAAARGEVDRLAFELASARTALDEAVSQVGRLQTDLEAARAPRPEAERELAEARAARNEALAELARVRVALEDHIIVRAALEHRASEALARAAAVESDLDAQRAAFDALRAERDALEGREASLQSDLSQILAELTSVRAMADQRRRGAQDLEGRLGAALAQVAALQQASADLERERAAALAARHDAETRVQAAALDALTHDALLRDEIGALRQQLDRVTAAWFEERTTAERLLRAQEDRERWLSQAAAIGVAATTEHGTILRANDRCATILGAQSAAELLARVPAPSLPPALVLAAFQQRSVGAAGQLTAPAGPVEVCVEYADGRLTWVQGTVRRVQASATEPPTFEWVLSDVTDHHLRARQADQTRRLDGARALAGAAGEDLAQSAHEAGRSAARLLDLLDAGSAARHEAEGLLASVSRLEAVLRQVVAFAQQRTRVSQVVDLDTWLPACAAALRRIAGQTITVEAVRAGRPLRAEIDPAELDQALSTLGLVAREALPFGGVVTLRLDTLAAPASTPDRPLRQMARLIVSLSGYGLRHGPSVAMLLEQTQCAGASLEARHEPAVGTTVSLLMPLVFAVGAQAEPASPPVSVARVPGVPSQ
jgi:hypothetical protein